MRRRWRLTPSHILRSIATAAIVAAALVALERLCVRPYRCNETMLAAQRDALRAMEVQDDPVNLALTMRRHERALKSCLECIPHDISLFMDLAAVYQSMRRYEDAERIYAEALRYHERPEIYLNLARVQLQQKKEKEAVTSFARAVIFNPYLIEEVVDPRISKAVEDEIRDRYPWVMRYGQIIPPTRKF